MRTNPCIINDAAFTAVRNIPGHGVLHLSQQIHGSLPITNGERNNIVLWMRSSSIRNKLCPWCNAKPSLIPASGFGDGFTKG